MHVSLSIETAERILQYFKLEYGPEMSKIPAINTLIQAVQAAKDETEAMTKYMDMMEAENARTILSEKVQGGDQKNPE